MPLRITKEDILQIYADVIVNSASSQPAISRGTETAIYQSAGRKELLEQRTRIGVIEEGDAAISPAFRLHSDYVIHTVCPVWKDGLQHEEELLASCYRKCLALAVEYDCSSIAIPLLSAGSTAFPNELALKTALSCLKEFLTVNDMTVYLVVSDRDAFEIPSELFSTVSDFIDKNQVAPVFNSPIQYDYAPSPSLSRPEYDELWDDAPTAEIPLQAVVEYEQRERLSWYIEPRKEQTFQVRLLKLIDASGETDPVIYKRANLDRKLFAKIRKDENYHPAKKTVIAFALALKLTLDDAQDLLARAGFALSNASTFDLIIRYCIENKIYNIVEVNSILFSFDQELL